MKKLSFTRDLYSNIVNLIVLIAGIGMFISAQGIETGAVGSIGAGSEIVPQLMTTIWIVLAGIIFIQGLFKSGTGDTGANIKVAGLTMALLFLYAFGLRPIGFVLSSMLYCFFQILLFAPQTARSKKHVIIYVLIALVVPFAINMLFVEVFSIILPRGEIIRIF